MFVDDFGGVSNHIVRNVDFKGKKRAPLGALIEISLLSFGLINVVFNVVD